MFRNEFWFSEISPNFQMAILFEKFKIGLELESDYEALAAEVNDLFSYREARFNRKLNRRVMILTIAAVILGFFGMNPLLKPPSLGLLPDVSGNIALLTHLFMLAVGGLFIWSLGFLLWMLGKRVTGALTRIIRH